MRSLVRCMKTDTLLTLTYSHVKAPQVTRLADLGLYWPISTYFDTLDAPRPSRHTRSGRRDSVVTWLTASLLWIAAR